MLIDRHAYEGMECERPRIRAADVERVLEEPDFDDGKTAWKRIRDRTVIIHYRESETKIRVASVSATRRRIRA